ncbi:DUF6538 domain-containing protein [Xanthomonas campestris]|uniref:DUF6538 domain-containing protein n=1 Tax=Xanthomonas campestris TaxID=339 RepID=UPI003CE6CEB2
MRRKHLHAHPSLFESFVQRVPIDLQTAMGCRLMKRTRQTRDLAQAYVRAVVLREGLCSALRTVEGSTRGQAQQVGR